MIRYQGGGSRNDHQFTDAFLLLAVLLVPFIRRNIIYHSYLITIYWNYPWPKAVLLAVLARCWPSSDEPANNNRIGTGLVLARYVLFTCYIVVKHVGPRGGSDLVKREASSSEDTSHLGRCFKPCACNLMALTKLSHWHADSLGQWAMAQNDKHNNRAMAYLRKVPVYESDVMLCRYRRETRRAVAFNRESLATGRCFNTQNVKNVNYWEWYCMQRKVR